MFDFLFRIKRWPIAIDFGADSIKMLQLRKVGAGLSASACWRWRFPESVREDPAKRKELAVYAVREAMRNEGFRGRWAISALSCEQLDIKSLRLPHTPREQLTSAVLHEAKERFGFEVQAGQFSYFNAGQIRQGNETRDEIIVLAAASRQVEEHLELLQEVGLVPEHIDAAPLALFRTQDRFLRRHEDAQAVSVLVDLGRVATRVVVAKGRQIVFIKSIDIGGQKFTEAVARQLHMTVKEAEEIRAKVFAERAEEAGKAQEAAAPAEAAKGDSLAWTVRDAMRGDVEALARELNLCLRYCAVTFRGLRADTVTLTGGESYDPAVAEILEEQLKLRCLQGQPMRGIDLSGVSLGSDRRGTLAEWAVCAGLAMRYVDMPEADDEADNGEHRLSA